MTAVKKYKFNERRYRRLWLRAAKIAVNHTLRKGKGPPFTVDQSSIQLSEPMPGRPHKLDIHCIMHEMPDGLMETILAIQRMSVRPNDPSAAQAVDAMIERWERYLATKKKA